MAYRYGDRNQRTLFPQSIDEYIPEDATVRAYDAIIDSLDFRELGIELDPRKVGCPQYDPKIMLKVLVYGYSYGVRSSRKLERELHYNLSFIWLTGNLKPDHKTIAEFRRQNKSGLAKVLRQCARLCMQLDLIEGNTLFVDGSKIKGNASIRNTWDKERCEHSLKGIDQRIEQILKECEDLDTEESQQPSLVKLNDELSNQQQLKSKIKDILKQLKHEDKNSINATDPECCMFHTSSASGTGYNVQTVVDEKHGLIVNSDVVNENNDLRQLPAQIEQAHQTLDTKCTAVCADAGYSSIDELDKVDAQGIKVIVPSRKQASKKDNVINNAFDKDNFEYDKENDCYICPQGHVLNYSYTYISKRANVYRISKNACRECIHFGKCTKDDNGRSFSRSFKEQLIQKLKRQYEQPEGQKIYKLRKQKAELPFGHIKRNLKMDSFLLRGLLGVRAEMSLLASCFNIARMITLVGVRALCVKLSG